MFNRNSKAADLLKSIRKKECLVISGFQGKGEGGRGKNSM